MASSPLGPGRLARCLFIGLPTVSDGVFRASNVGFAGADDVLESFGAGVRPLPRSESAGGDGLLASFLASELISTGSAEC